MDWNKTSAVSEILSSLAIVVTLIYLAIEIDQSAEATRGEIRQAMLASDQQFLEQVIGDPQLHLMWYAEELTEEERVRLSYFLITHLRMRENNWLQYKNGVLDEITWHSYRGSLIAVLSAPQARRWWDQFGVQRLYHGEFIAAVNALLEQQPMTTRSLHVAAFDTR